jgi:ATP-dependent RNA helicase DeaD
MPSFEDLGLREELLRALEDEDIAEPTALQAAVVPALRRGTNVVARASTGAGKTLAFVLGVLDRLQPQEVDDDGAVPLRVLVLAPTREEAERVALAAVPYAQAVGVTVAATGGGWGTPIQEAEVLVTPAADVMAAVRGSALKLEGVQSVIIDGASVIVGVGGWDQVDGVLDLVPREAQRVLFSGAFPDEVRDIADRRIKRALQYPSEAALPEERAGPSEGEISYVIIRGGDKVDVLVRQLAQPKQGAVPPVIFCRTDERAAVLAEQLAVRGFLVGAVDDEQADVAVVASDATRAELLEEGGGSLGQTISFDVPSDAATLTKRHGGDPDAVMLAEPRELEHVREIASMARLNPRPVALPADRSAAAAELQGFRERVRRAVREEDLAAQMLVLEPLLEEYSAIEVAAAIAAVLRRKEPAAEVSGAKARTATAPQALQARPGQDAGPAPASWSRLYVGVGSKDEVRPGDLVGALAGEANIAGSRIGKIEIRDSFSIVEVESDVADQVIRAVNGTTIKGRSARVDYDRGGERARKGGGGPPRRQAARPAPGGRRIVRRPPREPGGEG